eukprot:m.14752 g.14752  ORF g.14752 m.14752 type:complete len:80 (+) comp4881_c0_seq1:45-284(+)
MVWYGLVIALWLVGSLVGFVGFCWLIEEDGLLVGWLAVCVFMVGFLRCWFLVFILLGVFGWLAVGGFVSLVDWWFAWAG